MRIGKFIALGALLAAVATGSASRSHGETQVPSPYAKTAGRAAKTLSDQAITDLKAGRGMSKAMAAEVNGYPGRRDARELADALALNGEQRTKTQALRDTMRTEAISNGEQIIAEEKRLDARFAGKGSDRNELAAATARIGALQGALRATHLSTHLAMVDILSPAQTARYAQLRGYGTGGHD